MTTLQTRKVRKVKKVKVGNIIMTLSKVEGKNK
ncbi:hypothetical protein SAMN06296056_104235 [Priestia filamentosa]|nr:hypothetical protein SAMN06296056_104235 [Priestia filamentosa]